MKIVMTLMARNEADVIEKTVRYHLEAGIDFVIATDHRSEDGTTEIFRRYEREGHLHLIRQTSEAYRQTEWVTQMAQLAATRFGADWVINADADEFWWPHSGTLRDVLAAVPSRFGAIRGIWRHFVLRPENGKPFYERMIVRRAPAHEPTNPYCANAKVVHRGDPDVLVIRGNHDAVGRRLVLLREWVPFEVLHFPIRNREQFQRKYRTAHVSHRLAGSNWVPVHVERIVSELEENADDAYRGLLVDDAALKDGLDDRVLTVDTRLRDRLRGDVAKLESASPSVADDVSFAEEIDAMLVMDSAQRLTMRVDSFERRLAAVEAKRAR